MIKVATLPKGAAQAKYWTEFWTLLPKKRKFMEDNIVPRYGIQYFVWSRYKRMFYLRTITEESDMDTVKELIDSKWCFIYPNDYWKNFVLQEMEESGLSYYKLHYSRLITYEMEQHERCGDRTDGYITRLEELQKILFNLIGKITF